MGLLQAGAPQHVQALFYLEAIVGVYRKHILFITKNIRAVLHRSYAVTFLVLLLLVIAFYGTQHGFGARFQGLLPGQRLSIVCLESGFGMMLVVIIEDLLVRARVIRLPVVGVLSVIAGITVH